MINGIVYRENKAIEGLMICVTAHRLFLQSYLARKTKTGAQGNYK